MKPIDTELLDALQHDGKLTNVELARRVSLSDSPTYRRVKSLEKQGYIKNYVALLDQSSLGLSVTAYVNVRMSRQLDAERSEFLERVVNERHIIECHAMSGSFDFLLKVVAQNIEHFSDLCMQGILKYPGVQHVESAFSLKTIKMSHTLPVK